MLFYLLLILTSIATAVQLWFWWSIFGRLAAYKEAENSVPERQEDDRGVSLIICARNEADNLKKNLPRILNQKYRSLEVLVVNDNSTDETAAVVLEFQKKYPNLSLINAPPKRTRGKKAALAYGIASATKELILLTDADCIPDSLFWVAKMRAAITGSKEIVLGYSPYFPKRGFLNKCIRFEAVYTAIQYLSFALWGKPYMGVGRNLMYTKAIFENNQGFTKHEHITSGDDDLFVNQVADFSNTTLVLDQNTFVHSLPKESWQGYYYQKRRHLSTGRSYQPTHQLLLGMLSLSHFGHYAGLIALVFFPGGWSFSLILFLVRAGVVGYQYQRILKVLHDRSLWPWVLFLDAFFVIYYLVFSPALITTGKNTTWK